MNANVTWQQGMSFTGRADSGFKLPLGSGSKAGEGPDGFRPLELMAISLAGCTAMDVISILVKKQQAVTAFDVNVQTDRAEDHPRVFTHAIITYIVIGRDVVEAAVLRSIELSATKYCPAQAMLNKVLPIDLVYEIYEDTGDGGRRLVTKGRCLPQNI